MALVVADQPVDEGLAGSALQRWIERGAHRQTAAVKPILAVKIDDLATHLLGEKLRGEDLGPGGALSDAEWRGLRLLAFIGGGEAILDDAVDDPVAARDGAIGEFERIVVARRLGQRGEIGAVSKREFAQRLVPIGLRRSSDAVGARAEIDLVHIEFEDLLLGEGAFDANGKDRLLQLALNRLVARQEEVLGHLLGDGRGADDAPPRLHIAHIGDDGADDALNIEAAMLIEILVLGRDEGLDDALGNGRDGHVDASLAGELGNQGAVIGVDAGHHRRLVFGEHFVVRQLLRNLPQHEGGSAGDGDERNHAGGEHEAEEAQEKSAATAAPPLLRRLDWSRNVHGSAPSRPRF